MNIRDENGRNPRNTGVPYLKVVPHATPHEKRFSPRSWAILIWFSGFVLFNLMIAFEFPRPLSEMGGVVLVFILITIVMSLYFTREGGRG